MLRDDFEKASTLDMVNVFVSSTLYGNERLILFEADRDFKPLSIKLLLFGNDTLKNASTKHYLEQRMGIYRILN